MLTLSDTQALLGLGGVPLIVALVEAVKRIWPGLPNNYYPLASLAFGLLLNAGLGTYLGNDPVIGAVAGVLSALAASGLYAGGRAVTGA